MSAKARALSVLIPARNETFLAKTIKDVLDHKEGDTEVLVVLDGGWANPPIPDHPDVTLVYHATPVGQRAAVNELARMSRSKYIMKLDAHCAVEQGFDVKLMADCEPDWTVIPRMYNLHVFDWCCLKCGNRTYQGGRPERCEKCEGDKFEMVMVWERRMSRKTDFARFDSDLHFQYWGSYGNREQAQPEIADLMSFVGASFFMERERYFAIDGLDERHGSWGQMGTEIACKSWLSGGKLVVNKKTWFSHLFRTQPGFGFPYQMSFSDQEKAREHSRWLWNLANPAKLPNWEKAVHPLDWIIDKFAPVPTWRGA